jgi:hypothetical protein
MPMPKTFNALLLIFATAFNPDAEEPSDSIGEPLFKLANSDQYDDPIPDLVIELCKGMGLDSKDKADVTFTALLIHARHVSKYTFVDDAARDDRDRALVELVKLSDNGDASGRYHDLRIDRLLSEDGELLEEGWEDEDGEPLELDGDIDVSPLVTIARSLEPWLS